MPLYEFRCNKCNHLFERLCRVGSNGKGLACPICGARQLRRLMSVFSARVKGGGGSSALSGASRQGARGGCSTCASGNCATCR